MKAYSNPSSIKEAESKSASYGRRGIEGKGGPVPKAAKRKEKRGKSFENMGAGSMAWEKDVWGRLLRVTNWLGQMRQGPVRGRCRVLP